MYSELQTAVDKRRDRGAGTLVVCCSSRSSGKSQHIGFPLCACPTGPLPLCSRQPECSRCGSVPCLHLFGAYCSYSIFSTTNVAWKSEDGKDESGEKPDQLPKQQGWISKLLTGQQMDPSGWQKQSHSSLLSTSEHIYEFATHNYRPGEKEKYLDAFGKYKQEVNNKLPSVALIGSWTVSYGRTRDQAIHLWRHTNGYKDVDSSIQMHSSAGAVSAADAEVAKLCGRRKNIIVKSFSYWREPEQRPPSHVYDLRSYVLTPGSMIEWATAWAKGITFRRDANQDVGGFFAQV
ncbi:hypothetical protein Y032_0069g377 [Ancylostoma ceylanicum]|uniref:NIPSNAP domain-containing protein n=1 Tax=Ancylostoma ceylanicum TaxID=53326 RepID=A0A016TZH4_9BILA|nr:hypothetical protein Y032_0069g377 [Ancylostoma ceylanicum]